MINTSYKVQVDVMTDATRVASNLESGTVVKTETGYWIVLENQISQQNQWTKLTSSDALGLGWARWDDGQYTAANKFTVAQGTIATLPNNAADVTWYLNDPLAIYNPSTQRVRGLAVNDTYMATIVFKASAANANATYGELHLEGGNGTPYERLAATINFPKGNDVEHPFHFVFQYYIDADFLANGNYWTVSASGGAIQLWDVIMFIQRTQSR